ncbi:hypothetical protein BKA62DRAFT_670654 [Auriculariales sp. MPI-PUGE-AT-0066]|nr:hypothetical protein BKA62DRAFT_670654 [Auriculariales sp. MPI-PUGE-AT-0066]
MADDHRYEQHLIMQDGSALAVRTEVRAHGRFKYGFRTTTSQNDHMTTTKSSSLDHSLAQKRQRVDPDASSSEYDEDAQLVQGNDREIIDTTFLFGRQAASHESVGIQADPDQMQPQMHLS